MLFFILIVFVSQFSHLVAYYNQIYTLTNTSDAIFGDACAIHSMQDFVASENIDFGNVPLALVESSKPREEDPMNRFEDILQLTLFGAQTESEKQKSSTPRSVHLIHTEKRLIDEKDPLAHCPSGSILRGKQLLIRYDRAWKMLLVRRNCLPLLPAAEGCLERISSAELFNQRPAVHIPQFEYMHVNHCYLNITQDAMQTAVDAFAIIVRGSVKDVLRLDQQYVLNSARTIAMMRIPSEKLDATWEVVKGGRKSTDVRHWELELYRPLFKYLNGREIARLNLTNPRILTYIGTHAELNRHQVFYHIRACDPLQRRFYLAMMTRTDALGKSYSWNARDVARLGLLLAEVEGPDLAAVAPEAMSGLTAQVMLEMPASTLQYITDEQVKYLGLKSLAILARKLTQFRAQERSLNHAINLVNSALVVSFGFAVLKYFIIYTIVFANTRVYSIRSRVD